MREERQIWKASSLMVGRCAGAEGPPVRGEVNTPIYVYQYCWLAVARWTHCFSLTCHCLRSVGMGWLGLAWLPDVSPRPERILQIPPALEFVALT